MKAFVTGAAGFIGSRLIEHLQNKGFEVIALVRNESPGLPPGTRTVRGDILDAASLGQAGRGCDRLYHLAARISFDPADKATLLRVNGTGTHHVLAAARRWEVERSVVVSSAITLGLSHREDQLLNEEANPPADLARKNPYMASKLLTERFAMAAAKGQAVVIVNPTTVYGPGDRSLNSGSLVSTVARSAFLPVPPGGCNVVDVDDLAEGLFLAGEHGRSGRRYVLGGSNLRFERLFSAISEVTARHPIRIPFPLWVRRPMSAAARLAGFFAGGRFLTPQIVNDLFLYKYYSNERSQQELGWQPRYALHQTLERAWAFYRREGLI